MPRRPHLARYLSLTCALSVACGSDSLPSTDGGSSTPDARAGQDASRATDAPPPPIDAQLPEGLGWTALPGATIQAACPYNDDPIISGIEGCSAIINDWNGGIADTRRNRLIVWGGGHGGYFGNELYALDLATQALVRLNDASPPWANQDECSPETANGDAASRHTYDGLAYIEHADKMFVFGGSVACYVGGATNDTWTFDFASMTWERRDPTNGGPPGGRPGVVADYDPETRLVYLDDIYAFWSYDVDTNTYTLLREHINDGEAIDYHLTGRIEPTRDLFVIAGNGEFHVIDISAGSTYELEQWAMTGCEAVLAVGYPGLTWDPDLGHLVAWAGGDDVYAIDLDARACTPMSDSGGPGPQVENGTNGRWRYFPSLHVYALVNQWDQDAFLFRLTP